MPISNHNNRNISGIKLRGASFLMHQVYDDEMTFKLVAAASKVSGLPVEVCLEEFGKHFLVYCQKNGYDQILRVLGSNLYDFLTNLDNLHDHLASIYPGMRAPSFRVTRHMEAGSVGRCRQEELAKNDDQFRGSLEQHESLQVVVNSQTVGNRLGDELHKQNASCSLAGSMYLHYYSERAGLSPIVKGLVLAVAKEFFQTDIAVTECSMGTIDKEKGDDHVVLKIDRRTRVSGENEHQLDETKQISSSGAKKGELEIELTREEQSSDDRQQQQQQNKQHRAPQPQLVQSKSILNIYDSFSTNARDSLVNSEIMMQTFPFHVIFDRQFNLVQVGKSLLRVTSLFWQRHQKSCDNNNNNNNNNNNYDPTSESFIMSTTSNETNLIKFSDLFLIVRPKIEFTFDAIADHTNQVFVVKTKPLVLNADYKRSLKRHSSGSSGSDGSCEASGRKQRGLPVVNRERRAKPTSVCPFERIATERAAKNAAAAAASMQQQRIGKTNNVVDELNGQVNNGDTFEEETNAESDPVNKRPEALNSERQERISDTNGATTLVEEKKYKATTDHEEQAGELPADHLGLRLKGQMIILLGGELCLYLCSPRVDHLDQLVECGVNMSDFALHDRARELMLMSHTHKEDRETVKKLDQATNDLRKMDTKLRQENKRTEEVLHNIFPAKIATNLSHGLKVESESFDSVTCLYSDIIGFTKMCGSENVKPIDIVRLLNTLYLQFDSLTNIHGVFKVETIGDAYVVVGGLPEPAEDHADRCVRMGLDMVKVIATVRSPADNQPIQMRIGIHSGPVMAGIVGIRVPRYSLFGNTTTLANQLESHGVGGKIHISDFTLKNLIKRDRFVIEENPNELSGFPFATHFVTNYLADEMETLKHERILREQLVKDFALMGNELEFVDDSYPHSFYGTSDSLAATTTTTPAAVGQSVPSNNGANFEKSHLFLGERLAKLELNETTSAVLMDLEGAELSLTSSLSSLSPSTTNDEIHRFSCRLSCSIIDQALGDLEAIAEASRKRAIDANGLVVVAPNRKPQAGEQELQVDNLLAILLVGQPPDRVELLSFSNYYTSAAGSGSRSNGMARLEVNSNLMQPAEPNNLCPLCCGSGNLLDDSSNTDHKQCPTLIQLKLVGLERGEQFICEGANLVGRKGDEESCRKHVVEHPDSSKSLTSSSSANSNYKTDLCSWKQVEQSESRLIELDGIELKGPKLATATSVSKATSDMNSWLRVGKRPSELNHSSNSTERQFYSSSSVLQTTSSYLEGDRRQRTEFQRHQQLQPIGNSNGNQLDNGFCLNCRQVLISDCSQTKSQTVGVLQGGELDQVRRVAGVGSENLGGQEGSNRMERLLSELREERLLLQEQVERLSKLQIVSSGEGSSATTAATASSSILTVSSQSGVAQTKTSSLEELTPSRFAGQPTRVLSLNVQRMRRMDTLKLRKLKRHQNQLQQQQQQQTNKQPEVLNEKLDNLLDRTSTRTTAARISLKLDGATPEEVEEEEEEEEHVCFQRVGSGLRRPEKRETSGGKSGGDFMDKLERLESHRNEDKAPPSGLTRQPETSYLKQEVNEEKKRRTSSYSYHSLRFSLANLLTDSQQQPEVGKKKRFSLNPFNSITFTSPFSSPTKKQVMTSRDASGKEQPASRQASFSIRSSDSMGADANSPRQQSNRSMSNCSCLRSSISIQSVEQAANYK